MTRTRWALIIAGLLALSSAGAAPSVAQDASVSGWFLIWWGDGPPGTGALAPRYHIADGTRLIPVTVDDSLTRPLGGALRLYRKRVRVTLAAARFPGAPARVTAIGPESGAARAPLAAEPISGPQPWVTIMCRFADAPSVTPRDAAYVNGLWGAAYPGIDHFWREQSYDQVNLVGSAVAGWYNLPQPRAYYIPSGGPANLSALASDCTTVADADVYFPNFVGISLMFNQNLDCCAWGGSLFLNRDGQGRVYRMAWLPPWCFNNQGCTAHETGHGFGMPHSSGPYAATYDSRWDTLSDLWGNCPPNDPTYGCLGVHTVSYHKDLVAWMGSRRFVPPWGFRGPAYVERTALPASGSSYLMIQLAFPGSATRFYTVESRRFVSYDARLPGEAVILHSVDVTRSDRDAQVVDPDNNGNPDDAAAMWTVGETFRDKARGVRLTVASSDAQGFTVDVAYGPGDDTVGAYDPATATFYLRDANSAGTADAAFAYGPAGAGFVSLAGDWNGDGTDTVGLYDPVSGVFYLRNTNAAGPADTTFQFGAGGAGYMPLVGDWNGDGTDTVGLYHPATGTFYLRNTNSAGPADLAFPYGAPGAGMTALAGDWNGDGADTIGLYQPASGVFYLRNTNAAGTADQTFQYGPAGAGFVPVIGDWNGDLATTIGVYNPLTGVFYLRNSNGAGPADLAFGYGPAGLGVLPRIGDWNDR
jgi:hypothetical protein